MKKTWIIWSLSIVSLYCPSLSMAGKTDAVKMVATNSVVQNLKDAVQFIKKRSPLSIYFPTKIAESEKEQLYADPLDNSNDRFWNIDVTLNADCKTKDCVVGSMSAEKDGLIEKKYTSAPLEHNKMTLKEKITLANKITGYYTPAHAEADWHLGQIEWKNTNVKYNLAWKLPTSQEKAYLMKMANSAIEAGVR